MSIKDVIRIADLESDNAKKDITINSLLPQSMSLCPRCEKYGISGKEVICIWCRNAELEAELLQHEWISVEDRLPDKFDRYNIIACPGGMSFAETSIYHPSRKQFNRRLVSHWKPITLPKGIDAEQGGSEVEK